MPKYLRKNDLLDLVETAKTQEKKSSRVCFHDNPDDSPQEMFICHLRESNDWPHRNSGNTISFTILEGSLSVVVFGNKGEINKIYALDREEGLTALQLEGHQYISCIANTPYAIFHEIIYGPWDQTKANFFPDWAQPASTSFPSSDGSFDVQAFISDVKKTILVRQNKE